MGNKLSLADLDAGRPSTLRARLRSGANPNRPLLIPDDTPALRAGARCTPLCHALLAGERHASWQVPLLLEHGADPDQPAGFPHARLAPTPLHLAALVPLPHPYVGCLLAAGADPNARLQPMSVLERPPSSLFRTDEGPAFPGAMAAPDGTALVCGPPVGQACVAEGDTPAHIAASQGHVEVLQALLAHPAADPNARDACGRTALCRAVGRCQVAATALLASNPRVDVDAGGPLFGAISVESAELVQLLLDCGANVHAVRHGTRPATAAAGAHGDGDGDGGGGGGGDGNGDAVRLTPLQHALVRHSAFFANRHTIVAMLAAAGADVEAPMPPGYGRAAAAAGGRGVSPLEYAQQRGWPRVAAALRAALSARQAGAGGRQQDAAAAAATGPRHQQAASPRQPQQSRQRPSRHPASTQSHADLGSGHDDPRGPHHPRHLWWYVPAAAALRARLGWSLLPLTAVVTAALLAPYIVGWLRGLAPRARQLHPQPLPTAAAPAAAAGSKPEQVRTSGGDHASARSGNDVGEHGGGGGDGRTCCVCLCEPPTLGFVHGDVVHCCLCEGCGAELKRRGRLGTCPVCKRRGGAVLRVVVP